MGPSPRSRRKNHACCVVQQPLTPLMESPDPEAQDKKAKKERSWEVIRTWLRMQIEKGVSGSHFHGNSASKKMDFKLILGILGCPLAPIPLASEPSHYFAIKDTPIETSSAHYIIQQYLAATGCLKLHRYAKSMYAAGSVKMACSEAGSATGRSEGRAGGGENGCFVLWQMSPGMWLMELVAAGHKVLAGSDGKMAWRHLPWRMNAARGPQRPLRRFIQGLDPKSTASMFTKAQCLGEKRVGDDDCFVLKVSADRATLAERTDGPAAVIRHVLYGYFSQKSGLLIYMEDSHLTRVQSSGSDAIYWETTIGSTIEDYREVDNVLIAHQGRSIATVFRFSDNSANHSRSRMEEVWRIDDIVFNVPGLSVDCFIPPTEILNASMACTTDNMYVRNAHASKC